MKMLIKEANQLNLIQPDLLLKNLDKINLSEEESKKWCLGQKIIFEQKNSNNFYRTYNNLGEFIGITEIRENENIKLIKPKIVIA